MKRLIYLTAIVGFIMVSCAKPNDNPNPNEGETYSFEIGAEKEADGTDGTRVEVVDGLLHWSVGDQVGMYVTNTNGTTKHIDNFAMTGIHTEPTRNTTFKGLLTQSQISQLDPNSTYRHFSYHPYGSMVLNNISNYNTYGIVMTHTLPNQITVRPNEFPMDNVYLFAEEGSLAPPMTWLDENDEQQLGARRTFTYKHTMAYLRVRINENLSFRVFGKVEAFTFGERIAGDMAIIHVEKANGEIRGLYPFINQQFVENEFYDVKWINREEDMGEPGLRKAKESYRPARLVEKMAARLAASDPLNNPANIASIHKSLNDTRPNIVKTIAVLEAMENEVEEALLQIEAEEKAGKARYTPMEEVFAELPELVWPEA